MRAFHRLFLLVCAGTFAAAGLRGGDTSDGKAITATATEEQPEEYKNWIELAIGGGKKKGGRPPIAAQKSAPSGQPYTGNQGFDLLRNFRQKRRVFSRRARALGLQRLRHHCAIVEAEPRLHQGGLHRVSQLVRWQRRVLSA